MYFYDKRQAHSTNILQAHTQSLNVIAFNPVERFLFATASNDHTISLWDYRSLGRPIHSLVGHYNHVTSLQWSPFSTCILASGSDDCRVNLWDISKVDFLSSIEIMNRLVWIYLMKRNKKELLN